MYRRFIRLSRAGRERGQALVLFAAGLGLFLALVGMSIDVGQLVHARTDLQKMADAGAFGGAPELPVPGQATSAALQYIKDNGKSECAEECIVVSTTVEQNDTLTVTTKRRVNYTFLRILGLSGHDVSARAKIISRMATGYGFDNEDVFPYAVWGDRNRGPGGNCPYGLCEGKEVIYRSNSYGSDAVPNGPDNNPDWKVDSNKFKGYFNGGTDIVQMNANEWQTFSYGGNAQGTEGGDERLQALHEHYVTGRPIILPVIGAARDCGGSGEAPCTIPDSGKNIEGVQFKIVAWVAIKLTNDPLYTDPAFPWKGTVVTHYSSPKGSWGGGSAPPPAIAPRIIKLIE